MRLKTFTAPTMAEAMDLVRQEMGEDAVIVSAQKSTEGQGARVIAAMDEPPLDDFAISERPEDEPVEINGTIRQALTYHGTPARLVDRLTASAEAVDADNPTMAFAGAVDAGFDFAPLSELGETMPIMLVGPPGAGKTITTAKLAARSAMAGRLMPYAAQSRSPSTFAGKSRGENARLLLRLASADIRGSPPLVSGAGSTTISPASADGPGRLVGPFEEFVRPVQATSPITARASIDGIRMPMGYRQTARGARRRSASAPIQRRSTKLSIGSSSQRRRGQGATTKDWLGQFEEEQRRNRCRWPAR